jgi:hypothetical protein
MFPYMYKMKKTFALITASLLLIHTSGQSSIKNYLPKEIIKLDFSSQKENELKRQSVLSDKANLNVLEKKELGALLKKWDGYSEDIWEIGYAGCSWYCGGGNYKVKASSVLPNAGEITYAADNANDLNYKTAWVEGKSDEGIGEYLEYYFKNKSPRVTKIIISNGYVKSESAWKENNRVKKLKLIVNNKVFGVLNLEDSRTDQIFDLGTFGHNKNGTDLVLKFEILEVYKGEKFNDTVITEIYFDGIDVH